MNPPDTLHCANISIISEASCNKDYPGRLTDTMVCAGVEGGGTDSCEVRAQGGFGTCQQGLLGAEPKLRLGDGSSEGRENGGEVGDGIAWHSWFGTGMRRSAGTQQALVGMGKAWGLGSGLCGMEVCGWVESGRWEVV